MESILFLGDGPRLPILSRNPFSSSSSSSSSLITTLRATKLKFIGQSHTIGSASLTSNPLRPLIIRAIDSSKNDKKISSSIANNNNNNNNMVPSIALACVLGMIGLGYTLKMMINPNKAIAGPRELYQKAPRAVVAYPLGGRSALKSLLDVNVHMSSSKLDSPQGPYYRLPERPSMEDVNDIKMEAVKLMKYGKPEDAVLLLQKAYNSNRYDPEPAFHVEMALVEILICQGKYEEALKRNCLNNDPLISDGRLPLYKAIINTMLDEKEEAKKWWEKYVETVEEGFDPFNL